MDYDDRLGKQHSAASQEFSFAIPPSPSSPDVIPASAVIDLSPADDIFLHGRLLPLRLVSHSLPLPSLPQSRSNSPVFLVSDEFTFLDPCGTVRSISSSRDEADISGRERVEQRVTEMDSEIRRTRRRRRAKLSKYFHVFHRLLRWMNNDLKSEDVEFVGQTRRLPGCLSFASCKQYESDMPVVLDIVSPENDLLIIDTKTQTDCSTMTELEAAIQAAVAHCKRSMHGAIEEHSR